MVRYLERLPLKRWKFDFKGKEIGEVYHWNGESVNLMVNLLYAFTIENVKI